jgi:uncharacterized membrane protein
MESNKRSILKTASWYIFHLIVATFVAYLITGSKEEAGAIAGAEMLWESGLFYLHERGWAKWGKRIK